LSPGLMRALFGTENATDEEVEITLVKKTTDEA
jgi:hypothetical protein